MPLSRQMMMLSPLYFLSLLLAQSAAFAPTLHQQATASTVTTQLSLADTTAQNPDSSPVVISMTREEGKNEKLLKQLSQQLITNNPNDPAVDIVELPCIAHADGPDLEHLAARLIGEKWDYVAVTSPEAARVLASAWNPEAFAKLPAVAVVGKATEAALEKAGIPVEFCPSKATAEVLFKELPVVSSQNDDDDNNTGAATTVLYPASAKATRTLQDGLSARGFDVTRLNTYDTVTATWTPEQLVMAQQTTVVCVASPSSIQGWLANTQTSSDDSSIPSSILAACIGETSAQACRWVGAVQEALDYSLLAVFNSSNGEAIATP